MNDLAQAYILAMEYLRNGNESNILNLGNGVGFTVKILGWNPKFDDLETIITTAWKWHRNHPNGLKQNIQFSQNSLFSIYTWYGCAKYSV